MVLTGYPQKTICAINLNREGRSKFGRNTISEFRHAKHPLMSNLSLMCNEIL
jgi:hypothetical protein